MKNANDILKKFFNKINEMLETNLDEQVRQTVAKEATGNIGMQYKVNNR